MISHINHSYVISHKTYLVSIWVDLEDVCTNVAFTTVGDLDDDAVHQGHVLEDAWEVVVNGVVEVCGAEEADQIVDQVGVELHQHGTQGHQVSEHEQ